MNWKLVSADAGQKKPPLLELRRNLRRGDIVRLLVELTSRKLQEEAVVRISAIDHSLDIPYKGKVVEGLAFAHLNKNDDVTFAPENIVSVEE